MERAKVARSYDQLVALVRRGPPPWTAPFDALINLTEYFVHHEDVRRGNGDSTARPVNETAELEVALWQALKRNGRFMTRPVRGIGLDLSSPEGDIVSARGGAPRAALAGTAGEITLFLSGRGAVAHVKMSGPPEAVAALREAKFGL
jgi:uncharacterized protein (TIGR03085 family)